MGFLISIYPSSKDAINPPQRKEEGLKYRDKVIYATHLKLKNYFCHVRFSF